MPDGCPGTLVVHTTEAECTDPFCAECQDLDHALVIPCTDVDGGCPLCTPRIPHQRAA